MKEYLESFMKSNKPIAVAWLCWVGLFYAVTRQVTPHYYPYYALSAVLVLTVILTLRDTELSWVRAMVALTLVFFLSGAQIYLLIFKFHGFPVVASFGRTVPFVIANVVLINAAALALSFVYEIRRKRTDWLIFGAIVLLTLTGAGYVAGHVWRQGGKVINHGARQPRIIYEKRLVPHGFSYAPAQRENLLFFVGKAGVDALLFCLDLDAPRVLYAVNLEVPPKRHPNDWWDVCSSWISLEDGQVVVGYGGYREVPWPPKEGATDWPIRHVIAHVDHEQRRLAAQAEYVGSLVPPGPGPDLFQGQELQTGEYTIRYWAWYDKTGVRITGPGTDCIVVTGALLSHPSFAASYGHRIAIGTSEGRLYVVDLSEDPK